MKKPLLLIGSVLLSSTIAFGAAFQLNLQGLRQLAMGGTGTAVPWDAATIFYNPAGLSSLNGIQAYASVQALTPRTRYVATPTGAPGQVANSKDRVYTPFNVYVGGPIADKSRLALGVGIYTPFGTGIKWDDNWSGRYSIQEIQLQSIFIQPTVSYWVNDIISVGAGMVFATGNLDLRKAIPIQNMSEQDGSAELKGNAFGLGYNLGIHMRATDWLQFGINYRSSINMNIKRGYATFNVPASLSSEFPYTAFNSKINLPRVVSAGWGIKPCKNLTITADADFVGWSSYDSLRFNYETHTNSLTDSRAPRRYKNTVALRLGGAYKINDKFTVMAGAAWDPSPVKDGYLSPDLPDANHIIVSGGLTYKPIKRLTIIGAFEYVFTEKRTGMTIADNFGGQYQTKIINPGLGVSFDF